MNPTDQLRVDDAGAKTLAASAEDTGKSSVCAQCQSPEPWGESSWCPKCGYYPKFASFQAKPEPAESPDAATDQVVVTETAEEVSDVDAVKLPMWMKVLFGGVAVICVASVGFRAYVYFNGGRRAIWALLEMLTGIGLTIGSSVAAMRYAKVGDERMSPMDIVTNPINVWRPSLELGDRAKRRIWCFAWGLTMILAANVFVGGIKYSGIWTNDWGFKQPPKRGKSAMAQIAQAVNAAKSKDGPDLMEELLADAQPKKVKADPTIDCFVYGYLADGNAEMGRILMARKHAGRWKHAAVIKSESLSDEEYEVLMRMVLENPAEQAVVSTMLNANWVATKIEISMSFKGFAGNGELLRPKFHSIAKMRRKNKKGVTKRDDTGMKIQGGDTPDISKSFNATSGGLD